MQEVETESRNVRSKKIRKTKSGEPMQNMDDTRKGTQEVGQKGQDLRGKTEARREKTQETRRKKDEGRRVRHLCKYQIGELEGSEKSF